MPNMTLAIPEELHKIVKKHSEIKWSEIARRAMWDQAGKIEILDKLTSKSNLSKKDIIEIEQKVKEGLLERYLDENNT